MEWKQLRAIGNLQVLKVSYLVLVLVPFADRLAEELRRAQVNISLTSLGLLYFANLFLALANLVYDLFCPSQVKRFASVADMYRAMLEIRTQALINYGDGADGYVAHLAHVEEAYSRLSRSRPLIRWSCTILFLLAGGLFLYLLAERSWAVAQAAFFQA